MTSTPPPAGPTLADVGEFGLIAALTERFVQGARVLVGPGDDAAVVAVPDGRLVVSTDLLVEGWHFRRDWSTAADVGRKAAAQNLADINAMGGRATMLTVGFAAPPDLPVGWVLELADGIAAEAALVGASVVGGDVSRATEVVVAVTAAGGCSGPPVLRSGARAGDRVALAGRQGWAAAGLAVLARGRRSPGVLVEAHRRPRPPYDAGAEAAALGATAMIDVSDGLLADAGHIARASAVAIDLDRAALEVPGPLRDVGAALGVDPVEYVLTGGEDHSLLATFPSETSLPSSWRVVGAVSDGAGVTVDGAPHTGVAGHQHFG